VCLLQDSRRRRRQMTGGTMVPAAARSMCAQLQLCSACKPARPTSATTRLLTSLAPNSETTGKSAFLLARSTSHRHCPGQHCWGYAKALSSSLVLHCCSRLLSQHDCICLKPDVSITVIPSHELYRWLGSCTCNVYHRVYVCLDYQSIITSSYQPTL